MKTIKVTDTRIHKRSQFKDHPDTIIPGYYTEVPVAEAKLVFFGRNQCDGCNAQKPIVNGNHKMGDEGKYVNLQGCTKMQYLRPILISETEKIEKGDKFLMTVESHRLYNRILTCEKVGETGCYIEEEDDFIFYCNGKKIIALPEHFSPKLLQDIVDGKLKEGDRVLVECIHKGDYDEYLGHGDKKAEVKLSSSGHITLHKLEDKRYRDLEEAFLAGYWLHLDPDNNDLSTRKRKFKEWFDKNVK